MAKGDRVRKREGENAMKLLLGEVESEPEKARVDEGSRTAVGRWKRQRTKRRWEEVEVAEAEEKEGGNIHMYR